MSSSSRDSSPNNGENFQSSQTNVDVSQNPGSAYYLHPSENPGLILVSPALDGENYHQWSRSMKMSLISKNKLGFVNGTIPVPNQNDQLYSAWERANTMVISWIARSVSSQIAQSILWIDKASDIWKELRERFSHGDLFRIADLQEQIASFKQGEFSVSSYFTELKILWDELDNFRPLPRCTCQVKCLCDAMTNIEKYRSEDRVIRFLKGLNESYNDVRSQLMLMDPLPNFTRVCSLALQQEERQMNGNGIETKLIANTSNVNNVNSSQGSSVNGRGNSGYNRGRGHGYYQ